MEKDGLASWLTLALVLGLMLGMSVTAFAEKYNININVSRLSITYESA